MAFRFPLQAVLRYRESYERRERLRLQLVTHELLNARQRQEEANRERSRCLQELAKKLHQGLIAGELQYELACDRARVKQIAAWKEQTAKLEELRRRQLEAFHKAQQQRKILENLRDRQLAAYRLIQDRRTQQELDERFLLLHGGQRDE